MQFLVIVYDPAAGAVRRFAVAADNDSDAIVKVGRLVPNALDDGVTVRRLSDFLSDVGELTDLAEDLDWLVDPAYDKTIEIEMERA